MALLAIIPASAQQHREAGVWPQTVSVLDAAYTAPTVAALGTPLVRVMTMAVEPKAFAAE